MKHVFLILILLALPYAGWQMLKPSDRAQVGAFAKRHGVRFLIVVVVLFLLFIDAAWKLVRQEWESKQ